jgi:hypothetical protein
MAEHTSDYCSRLSWNEYLPRTIYATRQEGVPPVPEPWSASMGVAVAGSELEVSKTMEESVAKKSIGGCQIKMVQ